MARLDLSPSVGHRHLLAKAPLQLAYRQGDVPAWQRRVQRKLRQLLALPRNEHKPLRVRRLWRRETDQGIIEKLVFRSEPGVDVPCYWCLPHDATPPYRTFICLQGHSSGMHNSIAVDRTDETTAIAVEGDRDFALACMRRGLAALCVEQRSLGTRREQEQQSVSAHSACHDAMMRALLIGRTLQGERVFDVDRAIDYLQWRGDVNMQRLGVMGNSGGGTTAMFSAAVLPRIRAAMPSCSVAGFADSFAHRRHCGCNTLPGLLEWMDMADILGAIAPKPLVVVSGQHDPLCPLPSTRRVLRRAKTIYAATGAAQNVEWVVGPEGHRFYSDLAWPVMLKRLG